MAVLLLAVGAAEAERVEGEPEPLAARADDVDAAGRAFAGDLRSALAPQLAYLAGELVDGGAPFGCPRKQGAVSVDGLVALLLQAAFPSRVPVVEQLAPVDDPGLQDGDDSPAGHGAERLKTERQGAVRLPETAVPPLPLPGMSRPLRRAYRPSAPASARRSRSMRSVQGRQAWCTSSSA